MSRLIVLRVLRGMLTVWGLLTLVFIALRLSGDPLEAFTSPRPEREPA